jgi:hypothetical protein
MVLRLSVVFQQPIVLALQSSARLPVNLDRRVLIAGFPVLNWICAERCVDGAFQRHLPVAEIDETGRVRSVTEATTVLRARRDLADAGGFI